jgi:hypothetical protein
MCAPVALFAVGTALSLMSAMNAASAAEAQAKSQAQAYEHQRKVNETNAAIKQDDIRRNAARLAGRQRAIFGAAGVDLQGSPIDILAETAGLSAGDQYLVGLDAQNTSNILRYNADAATRAGRAKANATLLNWGADTVMRGAGIFGGGSRAPTVERYQSYGPYTNVDGLGTE